MSERPIIEIDAQDLKGTDPSSMSLTRLKGLAKQQAQRQIVRRGNGVQSAGKVYEKPVSARTPDRQANDIATMVFYGQERLKIPAVMRRAVHMAGAAKRNKQPTKLKTTVPGDLPGAASGIKQKTQYSDREVTGNPLLEAPMEYEQVVAGRNPTPTQNLTEFQALAGLRDSSQVFNEQERAVFVNNAAINLREALEELGYTIAEEATIGSLLEGTKSHILTNASLSEEVRGHLNVVYQDLVRAVELFEAGDTPFLPKVEAPKPQPQVFQLTYDMLFEMTDEELGKLPEDLLEEITMGLAQTTSLFLTLNGYNPPKTSLGDLVEYIEDMDWEPLYQRMAENRYAAVTFPKLPQLEADAGSDAPKKPDEKKSSGGFGHRIGSFLRRVGSGIKKGVKAAGGAVSSAAKKGVEKFDKAAVALDKGVSGFAKGVYHGVKGEPPSASDKPTPTHAPSDKKYGSGVGDAKPAAAKAPEAKPAAKPAEPKMSAKQRRVAALAKKTQTDAEAEKKAKAQQQRTAQKQQSAEREASKQGVKETPGDAKKRAEATKARLMANPALAAKLKAKQDAKKPEDKKAEEPKPETKTPESKGPGQGNNQNPLRRSRLKQAASPKAPEDKKPEEKKPEEKKPERQVAWKVYSGPVLTEGKRQLPNVVIRDIF